MDKYTVFLYPRAYNDIREVYSYLAIERESPESAKNITDEIKEKISSLELFPQAHQERNVGIYSGMGYRQLLVKNFIVIYKIDENEHRVYIVTVKYHKQNF